MGKKSKKKAASKPADIDSSGGSSEATSAGAANSAEAEALVSIRACINCDSCGAPSPQKKCANCLSFYYCSRECQVSHWRSHKETCCHLKKLYELHVDKQILDVGPTDTIDGPCVICLEDTVTNPVTLECGHVFCFECIGTYQEHAEQSSQEASCPYCRGELPELSDRSADRFVLYRNRAQAAPEGSIERKKFCDLALAEQESASQVYGFRKAQSLHAQAAILSISGDAKALLDVTNEILSECKEYQRTLGDDDILQTKIWRAEALSDMGEYFEASEAYQATHEEVQLYGKTSVQIAMGQSRCFYELGKYDKAIDAGENAVHDGRGRPQVHKYAALAQKAKGDIAGAKRTISRAILYERQWDKNNLEKNLEIQRDLDCL